MFCYFDSQDEMCRSALGAIKEGEYMRLRLRLPADCGAWQAFLLISLDGGETEWKPLEFEFANCGCLYYKIDLKLKSGLYWYSFCYETDERQFYIGKTHQSRSYGESEIRWQQSVYRSDYTVPDWLEGGLIYQIFPDRFYNSQSKKEIPEGRWIRSDWGATPEWRQNNSGHNLCCDFFGGDLKGIEQKLNYLKNLGVTCIYLNPIFMSSSNHRYNTMDYEEIDPVLGTEQDFAQLCLSAHKLDIKIILDGVFSHTGDDSRYFDRYNTFGGGAATDKNSPYFSWFKFKNWPNDYHSWWGVKTLPEVNEDDEGFLEYICGENGILRRWLRLGADGWRLDVADELPDVFLDRLRAAIKAENPNAFILGEVWEDASNKISYGYRRRYFEGRQLDSVMNYPFSNAIIEFLRGGNAENLQETVLTIIEHYPEKVLNVLMNHIGTHDTARILTMLGFEGKMPETRDEQSHFQLTENQLNLAKKRLKLASLLQYTLPGVPSLYYGDEAGMQGFGDPFCRGCYPWNNQDLDLLEHYKFLGRLRAVATPLKNGKYIPVLANGETLAFIRKCEGSALFVALNCGDKPATIPANQFAEGTDLINGKNFEGGSIFLPPYGFAVILK